MKIRMNLGHKAPAHFEIDLNHVNCVMLILFKQYRSSNRADFDLDLLYQQAVWYILNIIEISKSSLLITYDMITYENVKSNFKNIERLEIFPNSSKRKWSWNCLFVHDYRWSNIDINVHSIYNKCVFHVSDPSKCHLSFFIL